MDEDSIKKKMDALTEVVIILMRDHILTFTDAVEYVSNSTVLSMIDHNEGFSYESEAEFWADLTYRYNKRLESNGIKYKRL